jgi:serine/threonine protein kinase/tetratricopeptide (TPR) repeat protein
LQEKLGEGGMGIVFAAEDERLGRRVAVKMLHPHTEGEEGRRRLWREARAAAAINHPNVCQVLDVGEEAGSLWIAMELLEGEPLSSRVSRGPMPVVEAVTAALGILAALDAMHRRGVVHRDLKPSNVFLTPHGVKLLDFGLAWSPEANTAGTERLTQVGALVGTPGFMAPEQLTGDPVGPAADLFAFGAILFEMLTAKPAFAGATTVDVCHAVLHGQPPALVGGPGIEALDLVIQRVLAKRPEDRPAVAASLADELRAATGRCAAGETPVVRTMTRLVVLPLRVLRPDPDAEFLSFGLADALVSSLQRIPSLVVRSSSAAAKYAGPPPDLEALARHAQVDLVLLGTLMKSGDRVRVSAQLVEAPGGAVVRSETVEVEGNDLFRLQDDLGRRVAEAIAEPITARTRTSGPRDVPASPHAYELYLRGTQLSGNRTMWHDALAILRRCVDEDPRFAPAWARLGRQHRVVAKYGHGAPEENLRLAEQALTRALELNPDLGLAHLQYAAFEIEEKARPLEAMTRLLRTARRHPNDPDLFGGLVLACRFCGLLDASLAADRRARRLDPGVRTSVAYTWWAMGEHEHAMETDDQEWRWLRMYALPMLGQETEAVRICDEALTMGLVPTEREMVRAHRASILRDRETCVAGARTLERSGLHDPEGLYFQARALARVGETEAAHDTLERVVRGGFWCGDLLASDPWLEPARVSPRFETLRRHADERRRAAALAFVEEGGADLLGVRPQ